jgi:hypothetical protein
LEAQLGSESSDSGIWSTLNLDTVCRHREQLLKLDNPTYKRAMCREAKAAKRLRGQSSLGLCWRQWKTVDRREDEPAPSSSAQDGLYLAIIGYENRLTLLTMGEEKVSVYGRPSLTPGPWKPLRSELDEWDRVAPEIRVVEPPCREDVAERDVVGWVFVHVR